MQINEYLYIHQDHSNHHLRLYKYFYQLHQDLVEIVWPCRFSLIRDIWSKNPGHLVPIRDISQFGTKSQRTPTNSNNFSTFQLKNTSRKSNFSENSSKLEEFFQFSKTRVGNRILTQKTLANSNNFHHPKSGTFWANSGTPGQRSRKRDMSRQNGTYGHTSYHPQSQPDDRSYLFLKLIKVEI